MEGKEEKFQCDGIVNDVDSGVVASRGSELSDGGSEVSDVEELAVVEEVDLAGCFDVSYEKRNGEHGLRYRSVRTGHQSGGGGGADVGWRMVVGGWSLGRGPGLAIWSSVGRLV